MAGDDLDASSRYAQHNYFYYLILRKNGCVVAASYAQKCAGLAANSIATRGLAKRSTFINWEVALGVAPFAVRVRGVSGLSVRSAGWRQFTKRTL